MNEREVNLRNSLLYHLTAEMFPPRSPELVDICYDAVIQCRENVNGKYFWLRDEEGALWKLNGQYVTPKIIIKEYQLEWYLDENNIEIPDKKGG